MLDIADLEFFKTVSESHSLAAAARKLKVSAPAVSQRVSLLERRIGLPLFERKDQKSRLTDAGNLLARRGGTILSTMNSLMSELEQYRGATPTPLRCLVPMGAAGWFISQQAFRFMREHPDIKLQVIRNDTLPSRAVQADTWDIMVFAGDTIEEAHSERLDQQKICSMRLWLVASPEYIAKCGTPVVPEDLQYHACAARQLEKDDGLGSSSQPYINWQLVNSEGKVVHVKVPAQYSSNDYGLLNDWSACGMGIVARPEISVIEELMAGTLVRVLPDWELPKTDIVAVSRKQSLYVREAKQFADDLKMVMQDREDVGWNDLIFEKVMNIT